MSIAPERIGKIEMREFWKLKVPLLRAVFPKLIAKELVGVQPMMAPEINWNKGLYYKPYLPLTVHEYPYPEPKEFLKDEDILI